MQGGGGARNQGSASKQSEIARIAISFAFSLHSETEYLKFKTKDERCKTEQN